MYQLDYKTLDDNEIEKLIKKMIEISRNKGIKVTTQRILVFKELLKHTKEHPSAEELYERLKNKIYGLSLSTVYRTLTTFEKLGLVRRIPTPDGKAHFEIANKPHGHFICQNCGKVFDIDDIEPSLDSIKILLEEKGFKPQICNVICYGFCHKCN